MNENDIRDMFAAAALPAVVSRLGLTGRDEDLIARGAYEIAGAMMTCRGKLVDLSHKASIT